MEARLAREFRGYPVTVTRVALAGRTFEVLGPANYEELVDSPEVARRFKQNEYMPYWAQVWPASLLLAEAVAAWPPATDDPPHALEIGCGLGLVSLLLSHLGYRVVAADQDTDALAFVTESARHNGIPVPETRFVDWHKTDLDLPFDRIVAADVLYETRHLRPVAEFVHDHLKPQGSALIADPNRFTADEFDTVARHCGLVVQVTAVARAAESGNQPLQGRLFHLHRPGKESPIPRL